MTHDDLVKRAVRWLTNTQHCGVVLAEMSAAAMERPDAIGWQAHKSILVESKTSRSDYLAQRNKPCVQAGRLIGNERYYLCEPHVIQLPDVEGTDFGLLWIKDGGVSVRLRAKHRALSVPELCDERAMLVSALRRIRMREFLTIVPVEETM